MIQVSQVVKLLNVSAKFELMIYSTKVVKKLVFSDRALTEHSVQILSGEVLLRISEDFLRVTGFDDFT